MLRSELIVRLSSSTTLVDLLHVGSSPQSGNNGKIVESIFPHLPVPRLTPLYSTYSSHVPEVAKQHVAQSPGARCDIGKARRKQGISRKEAGTVLSMFNSVQSDGT